MRDRRRCVQRMYRANQYIDPRQRYDFGLQNVWLVYGNNRIVHPGERSGPAVIVFSTVGLLPNPSTSRGRTNRLGGPMVGEKIAMRECSSQGLNRQISLMVHGV